MNFNLKNVLFLLLRGALCLFLIFCSSCSQQIGSKNVIFEDSFSTNMDNWWVEGSQDVTVKNQRLYINANGGENLSDRYCTVWCKQKINTENVHIEFDAYVIDSKESLNNINFFLNYSCLGKDDLYLTRDQRLDGKYSKYHNLNGYIFTYINDMAGEVVSTSDAPNGRFRIRRCPGFELIAENYTFNAKSGVKRHIEIIKIAGNITYKVNGEIMCQAVDRNPLAGGYFGFRTYMTTLWVDNISVKEVR